MILVPQHKIDAYTARGWWGSETLHGLFARHRRQQPDEEAVVDAPNRADFAHGTPRRLSWAQLGDEVDRLALLLLDQGLRRDEVVVVQMPNAVEQFAAYLACARLGLVITPVPVQYREHELEHILELTQAAAALSFRHIGKAEGGHAAARMFVRLAETHRSLRRVIAWGEEAEPGSIDVRVHLAAAPTTQDLERLAAAERAAAVTANDVLTICWTSGTEAAPKGVPRSHNEWLVVPPSIIEAGEIRPHARLLNPFPLVNMAGFSTAFASWLVLGGTVVQHQPFSLPVFLQQLREERIDYTVAPPAILNMLLQNEALLAGIDFARLSRIGSGSAPLSDWMVRGFAEKHGVQIVNYFGSNEGAALAGNHVDIPDPALRAQFFPRAGVPGHEWSISTTRKIRTRLVDPATGEDIEETGRPGEIRFDGPTIFSGYWQAPELSRRAFDEQGFYKTGDLFEIAGERGQFYRYVGRSKDLVIRGGMNISSEEMENLLMACPGVREAAVVGVPDALLGEKLCACVVAADPERPPTLAAITAFLREEKKVAVYKLPEYLLAIDALPRNPVGKVLKRELRERARALARPAGLAGRPPVLLLIPGMLNTSAVWNEVLARLDARAEVRIAAVQTQTGIDQMARDAWALLADLPPSLPVALCGFSMGGYVAIEMLAQAVRPVAALALLDTSGRPESAESALQRDKTIAAIERDFERVVAGVAAFASHEARHDDTGFMDRLRGELRAVGAAAAIRQNRAIAGRGDHRALLARLLLPALVMCGRFDRVTPPALSEELAALIPGARLEWIEDAGHMTPLEQPARVAALLDALLAEIRSGAQP